MNAAALSDVTAAVVATGVVGAGTVGIVKAIKREEAGDPIELGPADTAKGIGAILALGIPGTFAAMKGSEVLLRATAGSHPAVRGAAAITGGVALGATLPFTLLSIPAIGWGPVALLASAKEANEAKQ